MVVYPLSYRTITTGTTTASSKDFRLYSDISAEITDELEIKVKQLEDLFFRKVVSKCPACAQWGAAMTECKHCGHPIDLGEDIRNE